MESPQNTRVSLSQTSRVLNYVQQDVTSQTILRF